MMGARDTNMCNVHMSLLCNSLVVHKGVGRNLVMYREQLHKLVVC
jgi:hypothetical protein